MLLTSVNWRVFFLDKMLLYLSSRDLIPGKGDDLAGQMAIQKVAVGYAVLKR